MEPDPALYPLTELFAEGALLHSWPWLLITGFVLLLFNAWLAVAEVAFLSMKHDDIELLRESSDKKGNILLGIVDVAANRSQLYAAIWMFRFPAMAAGGLIFLALLLNLFDPADTQGPMGRSWPGIVLALFFAMLLFWVMAEELPRNYAASRQRVLALRFLEPVRALLWLCRRPAWLLAGIQRRMEYWAQRLFPHADSLDTIREVFEQPAAGENAAAFEEERKLIRGILSFGSKTVRNVMRARVDVVALDGNMPFDKLVEWINENQYSRMPVYEGDLDHITGILHIKALLPLLNDAGANPGWQHLIAPPYFVPENKKIDDLLDDLKKRRLHIAIVVDEAGGTVGIVTLEDIIEEIMGEIEDESDAEDTAYGRMEGEAFVFDAKISLHDVARILEIDPETFDPAKGKSESLGGFVQELYGGFPKPGELLRYRNLDLTVEALDRVRLLQIRVIKHIE